MEDATYVSEPTTSGQCAFYGVFDGHGGRAAADFVGARLVPNIRAAAGPRVSGDALQRSMRDAYFQTDREFREAASEDDAASGATALVVCVASDHEAGTSELVVANAGDCRVVLSRAGKAIDLSTDQRPNCSTETSRIERAGGFVEDGYINGHLGVARAFGNFHVEGLKGTETAPGPLTVEPEVERRRLTGEDEFLVIACDGLWDVFSSNNAVDFARRALRAHNDPGRTARELCEEAGRRDSADNVSVIVVCFSRDPPPGQGARRANRAAHGPRYLQRGALRAAEGAPLGRRGRGGGADDVTQPGAREEADARGEHKPELAEPGTRRNRFVGVFRVFRRAGGRGDDDARGGVLPGVGREPVGHF
jgi:protein phosphatase 2C family protein 2/3